MIKLARAISVALVTIGFAASATAATYVVSAKNLFVRCASSRARMEAAGGTITARLPQIGVASSSPAIQAFAARASEDHAIRSRCDLTVQYKILRRSPTQADFANPPASGENDTRFRSAMGQRGDRRGRCLEPGVSGRRRDRGGARLGRGLPAPGHRAEPVAGLDIVRDGRRRLPQPSRARSITAPMSPASSPRARQRLRHDRRGTEARSWR
jgi:hypothetical protein